MNPRLRIAIVGFGLAGAAAAGLLRRRGHRIECFERSNDDSPQGAGLLLQPASRSLLRLLGIEERALALGSRVERVHAATSSGRTLLDLRYGGESGDGFALGLQRAALLEWLRNATPAAECIRWNAPVASVDMAACTVRTADGLDHGPYELIVGADGAHSIVRRFVPGIRVRDRTYRSAALVCLLESPDGMHPDALLQCYERERHVSAWPVGRRDHGELGKINLSINVSKPEAESWLSTGGWRERVERLLPAAGALLEWPANHALKPLLYDYRHVELRAFSSGRAVLVGDAAHSMSPQLGFGVQLALEDAVALAGHLDLVPDVATALRRFDDARIARVRGMQRYCRLATPWFQSESRVLATIRDAALPRLSRLHFFRKRATALLGTA